MQYFRANIILTVLFTVCAADDKPEYKMCVPHLIHDACLQLVANKESEFATIKCVSARDRMECLEKVNKREADFVAVDPEDMYVAFHMNNEDFSVFSEIRTVEEPDAEFRYEGIILAHKGSNIKSLNDLQGKKSCHTGYGRNVGYKIPITKLKKHGVFKVSTDPALASVEKELKGLSELFSKSCLVGDYSSNEDLNRLLKKRYSNLCALCEDPVKCNYPDKYSGYDGAIRCLVEKGGDVAFTKVIYVRRYFGLPINNQLSKTQAQSNPDDYEYLCEDGSRRAVTDSACTWAQRPWQGYMGNADIKTRLTQLQNRINEFYENGKQPAYKDVAPKLWINVKNVVVKKENQVLPGDHLIRAQYKDVIERDGSTDQKIRLCVSTDVESRKCEVMSKAAYSRDIRPSFACVMSANCIHSVRTNESDVVIIKAKERQRARENLLIPVIEEVTDDHYMIISTKAMSQELLAKTPVQYDANDDRSYDAAQHFNYKRGNGKCDGLTTDESAVRVIKESKLHDAHRTVDTDSEQIICKDHIESIKTSDGILLPGNDQIKANCYYDATPPTAIFTRTSINERERDGIEHAFSVLSDKFGKQSNLEEVFELFGEFEPGQRNVLFSDDADRFEQPIPNHTTDDYETLYKDFQCRP